MAEQDLPDKLFGSNAYLINRYVDILASRGIDRGLIGPKEGERLWERHIFNSVAFQHLIPTGSVVADIGSGAGLPGVPLALARPDLTLVLVESLLRRVIFLEEVIQELGLSDRVEVRRCRAEECSDSFDIVTARAVAPLSRLIVWTKDLFLPDGQLLAMKGSSAAREIAEASDILSRTGLVCHREAVRALPQLDETFVVRVGRRQIIG